MPSGPTPSISSRTCIEGALPGNTMKMQISGNGDERRFDVSEFGSVGAENIIKAATEAGCTIL